MKTAVARPESATLSATVATLGAAIDSGPSGLRGLRHRSLANLSRMGHCAPCIMQTMLEASHAEAGWLVRLTAGLPGGIGNTGGECGGVTAPLVLLGLRYGRETMYEGLPSVVDRGHDLLRRFERHHGTVLCREIRGEGRLPLRCVGVIRHAPELCARTLADPCADVIPAERRQAYCRLYACHRERGFHCAHTVLHHLTGTLPTGPELLDATCAFAGGTVYTGMTCSALTAGVMAIGVALAEIESSRAGVLRMIGTMVAGGDAFADDLNAFNRIMNLGHRLSEWFAAEFGATQCRTIAGGDFATAAGVRQYVENDGVARCGAIAQRVAARAQDMIQEAGGGRRSA